MSKLSVRQKQCLLAYLGYYTGQIDGLWGNQSRRATEAFQRDYQLTVDGVYGDETHARVLEVIASGEMPTISQGTPQEAPTAPENGKTGTFWDDIPDFKRREFACPCPRCGGFPTEPAEKLVRAAQALRDQVGRPMPVSSGVRCQAHNAEVGGVANSRHLTGHAMDFCVRGMSAAQVLPLAKALPGIVYAYAIDGSYVHMDIGR